MLAIKKTLSVVAIFVIALAMSVDAKKYPVTETVNVRSAPSVNAKIVRSARAGTYVDVTCQTTGDKVQNSNIWDKLTDGNYVFDQYVKTGYSGFSPDLPRCKGSNSPGTPNNGKINKEGLKLIEEFEGFRANFYIDPAGIKTIGYGHACHVDPNKCNTIKAPITRAQGEALLKKDLVTYEKCVSANTSVKLNSNQFSGLVSFTFNLGCGAYRDSTLRKKLNAGDTKGAAAQFGRWVYAGGKKLQGLVRRREAERKLFCKSGGC